jgi:hypothetical protein
MKLVTHFFQRIKKAAEANTAIKNYKELLCTPAKEDLCYFPNKCYDGVTNDIFLEKEDKERQGIMMKDVKIYKKGDTKNPLNKLKFHYKIRIPQYKKFAPQEGDIKVIQKSVKIYPYGIFVKGKIVDDDNKTMPWKTNKINDIYTKIPEDIVFEEVSGEEESVEEDSGEEDSGEEPSGGRKRTKRS